MQASVADKGATMADIKRTRVDVIFGATAGNVVSAFIIICTAATLFARGIVVETAAQAALALSPIAGRWAEILFGGGLTGASLLAALVLPLATTYAVCEVFGWERGLDHRPREAPAFYGLVWWLDRAEHAGGAYPWLAAISADVALSGGECGLVAADPDSDAASGK